MSGVVAVVADLLFQSKILETAKHAGVRVLIVTSGEAMLAALHSPDGERPELCLVDLNAPGNVIEAVESLRRAGNPVPVVAFLSHVQVELAERARAAGCTEVLPRSRFTQDLASILKRAKSE